MPATAPASAPGLSGPRNPRARRAVRIALLAAALFYVLYLVAGNLFLRPSVGPRLVHRPDREREISWQGGWTVVPGLAHVRGFVIDDRTRRLAWRLEVDRAVARVSLLDLLRRRFRAGVSGDGMTFRAVESEEAPPAGGPPAAPGPAPVAAKPAPAAVPPPSPSSLPSSATQAGAPSPPAPSGAAAKTGPGWTFDFPEIDLRGVREIVVRDYRFTGSARLEGGFRATVRGPFEIPGLRLFDGDGRLTNAGEPVAERLTGEVEASSTPFVYREHRGRPALRFFSGRLRLAGEQTHLDVLDGFFARAPWLDLEGRGHAEADVRVAEGVLAPQSRLTATVPDLALVYLGLRASGPGVIEGRVEGGDPPKAVVEARIAEFKVDRIEPPAPYLVGRGFTWRATGGPVDLAGAPPDLDVVVDLPDAEVPDLRVYNHYLPPRSGLAVTHGRGRLAAHLELSTREEGGGDGTVKLTGPGIGLRFREVELTGDLTVDARLRDAEPRERIFEVGGTRLRFDRVRLGDGPADWWGELTLRAARLALRPPVTGRAEVAVTVRDSAPLVALFVQDRPLLKLVGSLLEVRDLTGTAAVGLTGTAVALEDLHLTGERFTADARLCFAEKRAEGVLYLRRKRFALAAELLDGERHWDLVNAREWYDARLRRHLGERCGG